MSNLKVCKKCKANNIGAFNGYWPYLEEDYNICKECGGFLENTNIDSNDFWIIWTISHDNSFLEAMIDLHDKDIIEYELKMSQFRTQLGQQKAVEEKQEDNAVKCPYCKSDNVRKISATSRASSVMMFGILSKKIGKQWRCNNCKSDF